jgi:hypothetical protein
MKSLYVEAKQKHLRFHITAKNGEGLKRKKKGNSGEEKKTEKRNAETDTGKVKTEDRGLREIFTQEENKEANILTCDLCSTLDSKESARLSGAL